MPVARMKMRPWLEKVINSDVVDGLTWLDPEKTLFSIPWKHAARHGWEIGKDANLFKMWAIHTGKYVEGQTCDPKTWKANFRCAMNSLPDITEMKKMSINKGHQAVRVFKMLPVTTKAKDKRNKAKEARRRRKSTVLKTEEDMDSCDNRSSVDELTADAPSPQDSAVDSTVKTEQQELRFSPLKEVPDFAVSLEVPDFAVSLEVPDFAASVEITNFNMYRRFEVSPEHSLDYHDDDIIQICEQLERETSADSFLYGSGFLTNEASTSPGSQWSESSSGEDVDDPPHYTTLGTDFSSEWWKLPTQLL